MPRTEPLPTLGYSSQAAAIRALAAQGLSPNAITARTGLSARRIYLVLERDPPPVERAEPRKPHRAVVDPNKIVSGVLPPSARRALREIQSASPERMTRNVRARDGVRYRLQAADGKYLRFDTHGHAERAVDGWVGFGHQLKRLLELRPELEVYRVIEVRPARSPDVFVTTGRARGGVFGRRTIS